MPGACGCAFAPTIRAASERSSSTGRPSSSASCSMCCRRASSASGITGCSARRSSKTGWPRRVRRWACRRSIPRPARCGAVPPAHHGIEVSCCPHCRLGSGARCSCCHHCAPDRPRDGSMQGTPLSTVGCITVKRPLRCRLTNGGVARAQPGQHAAGAHIATHRWTTRHVHPPLGPRAARCLALPTLASATPAASEPYIAQQPARHRTSGGLVHRRLSAAAKSARPANAVRRQISALRSWTRSRTWASRRKSSLIREASPGSPRRDHGARATQTRLPDAVQAPPLSGWPVELPR